MSSEMARLIGEFFHGWWEIFVLFMVLLVATVLMSWSANRGLRPVERGPLVPALPFLGAFALMMIVRHMHNERLNAIIIAVGVTIAGLLVAKSGTRAPVLPIMLLAVLLGFGLNLSAMALLVSSILVLVLSRSPSK
jgi:hypothetical protein